MIINNEFVGSAIGILRLCTLGLGGAVFGTLVQNGLLLRPTSHLLMWNAVFAWIMSMVTFIAGVLSRHLFVGRVEWRVNFIFSTLYAITTVLYGIWDIMPDGTFSGMALLVFIYAALNVLIYFILSLVQLFGPGAGKMSTRSGNTSQMEAVV